ncbi:CRP/FNR family transcriptional regulator [Aequitasia blattaphilus]|uniref:Crp/Fnr family transcriptional regulator n=1 Tax=Aequitasia blattaphilus TaxID=2949332 RepID=A0ABT1EAU3_9FIRM|nr:Crp/Fnr family transcriptional regulator [Aequitasia blattaphilus]MCP1102806.1 Crp/Fnr family transcriptional regulator [Aequitasia blattaphilus]MCR8615446.1 Crp/Fnr family transcriptional regulator [Aequitasia blattaphilus]
MVSKEDLQNFTFSSELWERLTESERDYLLANATSYTYQKGELVHSNQYECVGIILVQSGTLRVYILSDDGREVTLFRINEGEMTIMGATCVLHDISTDVFIDAQSDCQLIQVPSSIFEKIMTTNVSVEALAYRMSTAALSDAIWALQQILFLSFDKRLAIFLLDESAYDGTDTIYMTHEEIAKLMGSAREVVSRMLKYFSAEGYVELSRGSVRILDKKKLTSLLDASH